MLKILGIVYLVIIIHIMVILEFIKTLNQHPLLSKIKSIQISFFSFCFLLILFFSTFYIKDILLRITVYVMISIDIGVIINSMSDYISREYLNKLFITFISILFGLFILIYIVPPNACITKFALIIGSIISLIGINFSSD